MFRAINHTGNTIGSGSRENAIKQAVSQCTHVGQTLFYLIESGNGTVEEVTIETRTRSISRADVPEPVRHTLEGKL
jgi:phosphoribosylamine-glycine ligase